MQNAPRDSAILLTSIKLPSVFGPFILSIFEWPLKTGFTVNCLYIRPQKYNYIDGWLIMGLLPLGNFADISYLVEN